MVKKTVFLFVLCAFSAYSAVNFPYPQEKTDNGTIKVSTSGASAALKSKFESFYNDFYEEGNCNGTKDCARIKYDTKTQTVSEGIGYGMIMMVYFSDNSRSYQSELDKLWAYYKKWPNTNPQVNSGLMHWKIEGFSRVIENGAATDAEFDVALALAMAYYQFGDEKYRTDASNLIAKIRQFEMNPAPSYLHKPGDSWDDKKNPSYVSPAAFEIFRSFDQDDFWQSALTANYALLKNNQNGNSNKLPSDWCTNTGSSLAGFSYDASRAPWRWAWSYQWYAHNDAKILLENILPYVNNLNPENTGYDNNSTFVGSLMSPLIYSSTYQNKLNGFWSKLMSFGNDEWYFSQAMKLLTGLLATGNMPNLKALAEAPPSSSSAEPSSSSEDDTPILTFPKTALLNTATTSKNGISLAVKNNAVVEVFGLKGNSIRKFRFANGVYSVSFSDLPKGLYIVRVSFGSEKKILRVPVN